MNKKLIQAQYEENGDNAKTLGGGCPLCIYHKLKEGIFHGPYHYCNKHNTKVDVGHICKYYEDAIDVSCFANITMK